MLEAVLSLRQISIITEMLPHHRDGCHQGNAAETRPREGSLRHEHATRSLTLMRIISSQILTLKNREDVPRVGLTDSASNLPTTLV